MAFIFITIIKRRLIMEPKTKIFILIATVVILIAAFTAVIMKFRKDLTAGYMRINDIKSQIYKSRVGDVEYFLEGNGPTILISHGITGGIDQGMWISAGLGEGYRFLYVSRFGYLRSSMPDEPSVKLQAEVYKDLLDFLGIDSVFIMGNSAGGASVIQFAIDHPGKCRGLILESSVVPGDTRGLLPKPVSSTLFGCDFLYWSAIRLFGNSMLKMFVPESVLKTKSKSEIKNLIDIVFISGLPISNRTKGVMFDTYISNPSINSEIPFEKIKAPALIIHAIDDPAPPVEGARTISGKIPNCELVTYETGGHILLNHEDEIKERIRNFIFR
jgi:pimeloyl-ACP methyl ester carboxylesterase